MNDALGDRMKEYEMQEAGRKFLPLLPVIARLDGRSFSSFTRGLNRPYDERFSRLMIYLARFLVEETNACCGYTQSDEITLAYYSPDRRSQIFFDGRIQKMVSVLPAMASADFMYLILGGGTLPKEYAFKLPHFDCRCFELPTLNEAANCFLWREWDATKNSISMAAQEYYSHSDLMNKNGAEKQEMLFAKGVNWNDYPDFFKRGSFVQRRTAVRKFTTEELDALPPKHEARTNPDLLVERQECKVLSMPPFAKVTNRVGVIFYGEEPKTEEQS